MIVAVTGGTGFIGRHLVLEHVARGDEVRVLSRHHAVNFGSESPVKWFEGDISKGSDLVAFVDGADVLYHCAGEICDTSRMRAVHVEGTASLVSAATGRIARWIQLSSVGAYGKRAEGVVTENTELNPVGVYETTKLESDLCVTEAALGGAFEYAVLRPSNVFGNEMRNQSLFRLVSLIDRGLFRFVGPAGASANYIHVKNVAEALVLCGTRPEAKGQIFNLSDYCTFENFVGYIAQALNKDCPRGRLPESPVRIAAGLIGLIPNSGFSASSVDALTTRVRYSSEKITEQLGYRHSIRIEEGVQQLVHFWKQKSSRK